MAHIYKTTNNINGKIYIGKEKNNDINYFGSGVLLNKAIKKYGKEAFTKEILEVCDYECVDERECYWIAFYDTTNRNIGYNLTKGGTGGDTTSQHPNKDIIIEKRKAGVIEWHKNMSLEDKDVWKQSISANRKGNFRNGKTHTEESKKKIRESNKKAALNRSEESIRNFEDAMAKRKGKPLVKKYKKVLIDGIVYNSISHACLSLGFNNNNSIYQRVKRGTMVMEYL